MTISLVPVAIVSDNTLVLRKVMTKIPVVLALLPPVVVVLTVLVVVLTVLVVALTALGVVVTAALADADVGRLQEVENKESMC